MERIRAGRSLTRISREAFMVPVLVWGAYNMGIQTAFVLYERFHAFGLQPHGHAQFQPKSPRECGELLDQPAPKPIQARESVIISLPSDL